MDESKGQAGGVLTPVAMSRESRAMLLNVLWHHQGGSSPVGQPLRKLLGIEQHAHLTGQELSEAKWIDKALVDGTRPTPAAAALGDTRQFSNLSNQAHGFASPAAAAGVPTGLNALEILARMGLGPQDTAPAATFLKIMGERGMFVIDNPLLASSPVAPAGAPTRQLEELIAQYWTLAYAEGKEGRDHDTEGGAAQQCWHEIKEAIALLSAGSQGEQHAMDDVQRVLGYLQSDEREIRSRRSNFTWADTMARASDLIRNLAASRVRDEESGWRTSPDGLSRKRIAPDAATGAVPSPHATVRFNYGGTKDGEVGNG